jgi:hypothetical protein
MPNVRTVIGQLARLWRPAMTLGLLVLVQAACVRYPAPIDVQGVASYVSSVQLTDSVSAATIRSGMPTADPTAPALRATLGLTALEGGTTEVTATSATPFTRIAVTVPGSGSYWDVTLARPTTVATIRLTFADHLPTSTFELRVAGADAAAYGAPAVAQLSALAVADGGRAQWFSGILPGLADRARADEVALADR